MKAVDQLDTSVVCILETLHQLGFLDGEIGINSFLLEQLKFTLKQTATRCAHEPSAM